MTISMSNHGGKYLSPYNIESKRCSVLVDRKLLGTHTTTILFIKTRILVVCVDDVYLPLTLECELLT